MLLLRARKLKAATPLAALVMGFLLPHSARAQCGDSTCIFERLAGGIRIPTVSYDDEAALDTAEFIRFHAYLENAYPLVSSQLSKERVNGLSLLYTWQGTDPDLKPALFIAHMDVVPVEDGEAYWKHGPFSGDITHTQIWGRGTMDVKFSLFAMLEGVEKLLKVGYKPRRTILFAFGHDEEAGGWKGCHEVSILLKERYGSLELVMDEGGAVGEGVVPGVSSSIAGIGITEKGYLVLKIMATALGGHSSVPYMQTAIGMLSGAMAQLEAEFEQYRLTKPVRQMLAAMSRDMTPMKKLVMKNSGVFSQLVKPVLRNNNVTRSLLTTTFAPTTFYSGFKENIMPTSAAGMVNFRILPGTSIEQVVDRVEKIVSKYGVKVEVVPGASNPAPVTDIKEKPYRMLVSVIEEVFKEAIPVPVVNIAVSDSRHFTNLSENILRFVPLELKKEDVPKLHGTDECISKANYLKCIDFYSLLLRAASFSDDIVAADDK
jgi:carboxypeptidase PM20D1